MVSAESFIIEPLYRNFTWNSVVSELNARISQEVQGIFSLGSPNLPQNVFNFCMVPFENSHVLALYVAKLGLPIAYAENCPLQHPNTFVC
jgi:hypothetical protein